MDQPRIRRARSRRLIPLAVVAAVALVAGAIGLFGFDRRSSLWAGHWTASTWPAGPSIPGNPISMTTGLYVDPDSQPAAWVRANPGDPRRSMIKNGIASVPMGRWFVNAGDDHAAAADYVRRAQQVNKLPVLVAYNIPGRDCGGYSGGGAPDAASYRSWIDGLVDAIGTRPAVVILEPDALAGLQCRPGPQQEETVALISYAVEQFAARTPNTWVYLDAGHPHWSSAATMAKRLREAHVQKARGFALNISNFQPSDLTTTYGQDIASLLAKDGITSTFVIDNSRNGHPDGSNLWCNPGGQRVGQQPRPGGATGLDLQLWVKSPGEADGACGSSQDAAAGSFQPGLAVTLLTGPDPMSQWALGVEKFAPSLQGSGRQPQATESQPGR
jgi:endoglucanase